MSYNTHGYDIVLEISEKTLNSAASSAFHSSYFTSFKGNATFRSFTIPYVISLSEPPHLQLRRGAAEVRLALHVTSGRISADAVAYCNVLIGPGLKVRNVSLESARFGGYNSGTLGVALLNLILHALPLQKLLHVESVDTDMPLSRLVPASMLAGSPTLNISAQHLAAFQGSLVAALCLNSCPAEAKTEIESFAGEHDFAVSISETALNDLLVDIWPNLTAPLVEEGVIESDSSDFVKWLKQVSGIRRPFWGGSRAKVDYRAEIRPALPKVRINDHLEISDADLALKIKAHAQVPRPFSSKELSVYKMATDAKAIVEKAVIDIYASNGRLFAKVKAVEFSIDAPQHLPDLILKTAKNRLEDKILNLPPTDLTELFEKKLAIDTPIKPEFLIKNAAVADGVLTIRSEVNFTKLTTSSPFIADAATGVVHIASCPGVAAVGGAERIGYASLSDALSAGYQGARDCLKRYQHQEAVLVPDVNVGKIEAPLVDEVNVSSLTEEDSFIS